MIVHVASELAPIAKVGGLGDVVYGLSKELIHLGEKVLVVLPKYHSLDLTMCTQPRCVLKKTFQIENHKPFEALFWTSSLEGISLLFIDPQSPENIFQRKGIYGEVDDIDRFLLFCFLTLEYLLVHPPSACTLHLHDWPTAFVACLYKQRYQHQLPRYKILVTIHNILHQGRGIWSHIDRFGIKQTQELADPTNPKLMNLLKSGLIYCDHITTVSPTYAREILTHELGYHLHSIFTSHPEKLSGILNGIDLNYWNPCTDKALIQHYSPSDPAATIIHAKEKNKAHLRHILGMPSSSSPLIGCITRLDTQKGPHLIAHAITTILKQGGQCILLGHATDPNVQEEFNAIRQHYSNNANFHFHDQFDESLARLIYASADFMIIPSLFEPCGLTQMIAMRYSTIPIARTTGGLADTVHDIESQEVTQKHKVGICFRDMNTEQLDHALERAFLLYQDKPSLHHILKNLAMQDFSWKTSAKKYLKLYDHL